MSAAAPTAALRPAVPVVPLLAAFGAAVAVRVALAGDAGASAPAAAMVFAAVLAGLVFAVGARTFWSRRVVVVGLASAVVLVVPAMAHTGVAGTLPSHAFPAWAVLTTFVAGAEEAFLRGTLFEAVQRRWSGSAAVVVAALAFAALHVPLYGWHVLPVDIAVGLLLGAVRLATGTWTAPAVAHVGADLAGWWLL